MIDLLLKLIIIKYIYKKIVEFIKIYQINYFIREWIILRILFNIILRIKKNIFLKLIWWKFF